MYYAILRVCLLNSLYFAAAVVLYVHSRLHKWQWRGARNCPGGICVCCALLEEGRGEMPSRGGFGCGADILSLRHATFDY